MIRGRVQWRQGGGRSRGTATDVNKNVMKHMSLYANLISLQIQHKIE